MTLLEFALAAGSAEKSGGASEPEQWLLYSKFQVSDSTFPFQNKSSHTEPFMEFYFSPILVFQNISLANCNACKCNDWSPAASLLLAFSSLSLCSEGVKSKSYGQARAEPGNKGIIFISLLPIKVSHKRKKAPHSNRREIQDFDESTPPPPTTI